MTTQVTRCAQCDIIHAAKGCPILSPLQRLSELERKELGKHVAMIEEHPLMRFWLLCHTPEEREFAAKMFKRMTAVIASNSDDF